jgi:hypothetical protein
VSGSPVAALDRRSWASAKRDLCENFASSANFSKLLHDAISYNAEKCPTYGFCGRIKLQMILYFNCNYSLNILNWQKQDVAHWFGCAEETKFQRRVFENILVKWRVQIICPKLYNYIQNCTKLKIYFPLISTKTDTD